MWKLTSFSSEEDKKRTLFHEGDRKEEERKDWSAKFKWYKTC